MKIFGSITKLVSIVFQKGANTILVEPSVQSGNNTLNIPDIGAGATKNAVITGNGSVTANTVPRMDGTGGATIKSTSVVVDDTNNITGVASITVGNTGLTVGTSVPFSDSTGTLTLQNVDALDATTEATIESAIDTLANLTSIQSQTVTLSGSLTVESASTINQDVTTDASPTFASVKIDENGAGTETVEIVAPTVSGNQVVTLPAVTGTLATLAGIESFSNKTFTDSIKLEDPGVGTNKITIQAPTLSGDVTLTLPANDGNANEFLRTDGSGNLTWAVPAGAGDVVGPASSIDNSIVRFDGTTGKLIQGYTSGAPTISDTGVIDPVGGFGTTTNGAASATESGLITTGAQTIAGAKTFTGNISFDGGTFVFNESGADKDFRIEGDTNTNLFFCDASTDRVGIGTNSPDRDLQVESTGSAIIKIECGNGTASYVQFTEGGSSNEWYAGLVGNDGNKFRIANEGDVGVFITHGGTSWSSTSDYRLKENWKEIAGAVDILSSWSCGKYNLIGQPLTEIKVGLIAQEVKNTLPEVVDVAADSTLSIRYTEILPILVKAIQEQQSQIEELKSKLAILESK